MMPNYCKTSASQTCSQKHFSNVMMFQDSNDVSWEYGLELQVFLKLSSPFLLHR